MSGTQGAFSWNFHVGTPRLRGSDLSKALELVSDGAESPAKICPTPDLRV